jgi:hypothetical protein
MFCADETMKLPADTIIARRKVPIAEHRMARFGVPHAA